MALKSKSKAPLTIIKKVESSEHAEGGGGHGDEGNWLVSYADMMTLLCGFFIMMFSMATLDKPKYDSLRESISKQFGGEFVSPTKELAKFATNIIQELGLEKEATIKTDDHGISVTFESTIFFETSSAELTGKGREVLEKLSTALAKREKDTAKIYPVVVEGHTDSRPIKSESFASNWELSGNRATRVVRLFLDKGYPAERLTAIGYGATRPIATPDRKPDGTWDEEALTKNRRVVIRVLEPQMDTIPMAETAPTQAAPAATAAPTTTPTTPTPTPETHP